MPYPSIVRCNASNHGAVGTRSERVDPKHFYEIIPATLNLESVSPPGFYQVQGRAGWDPEKMARPPSKPGFLIEGRGGGGDEPAHKFLFYAHRKPKRPTIKTMVHKIEEEGRINFKVLGRGGVKCH